MCILEIDLIMLVKFFLKLKKKTIGPLISVCLITEELCSICR